jgi:hypothetical protein
MPRDGAACKSMSLPFTISDLRQRPEFFDIVAMRIWQAWRQAVLRRVPAAPVCARGRFYQGLRSTIFERRAGSHDMSALIEDVNSWFNSPP